MVRLNQAEERRKESIEQRSASLSERNLMSARNSKEKSIDLTLGKY